MSLWIGSACYCVWRTIGVWDCVHAVLLSWLSQWNMYIVFYIGWDGEKGPRNLVPCYPELNCRGNQFVTRFCCQSGGKSYMDGNWGPTCKIGNDFHT